MESNPMILGISQSLGDAFGALLLGYIGAVYLVLVRMFYCKQIHKYFRLPRSAVFAHVLNVLCFLGFTVDNFVITILAQVTMGATYVVLIQSHSELMHFLLEENIQTWVSRNDGSDKKSDVIDWKYKKYSDLYFSLGNLAATASAYMIDDTTVVFQLCAVILAFYTLAFFTVHLVVEID